MEEIKEKYYAYYSLKEKKNHLHPTENTKSDVLFPSRYPQAVILDFQMWLQV